jgi:MFS-type transporter involved in bile tolerance (Atg22 family)
MFGFLAGPIFSFTRSCFAQVIPRSHEAAFFSLYQLTAKGTTWLGPLIFLVIEQITHDYRTAFSSIVAFFLLGFILLQRVDFDQARADAENMNRTSSRVALLDTEDPSDESTLEMQSLHMGNSEQYETPALE